MWSDEWQSVRRDVLERDDYSCRECPRGREDVGEDGLHAHHIRPRSAGGPDERENLVTLCERCHTAKHSGRTSYYDAEFVQVVRGYGPIGTGEVAEWLTCSRTTARRRLSELESSGRVVRDRDGDAIVWRGRRGVVGRILGFLNPLA